MKVVQSAEERSVEIEISRDVIAQDNFRNVLVDRPAVLITDTTVEKLHGAKVRDQCAKLKIALPTIAIKPGEHSKTRETKAHIEDQLLSLGMGRDCIILALGGGVVSDMAGFVAATYCRGVDYAILPTTLLAMVDASIGGKTAVNIGPYKNIIGAFHLPIWIGMDAAFLRTLADNEWRNGIAEIIKYGAIASKELLAILQKVKGAAWQQKDLPLIEELVRRSVEIKGSIVKKDPKEQGLRRSLNFGHTIGHAIEGAAKYRIAHGDAIAIGMAIEAHISVKMGLLPKKDYSEVEDLLKSYGFSLELPSYISRKEVLEIMHLDKKAASKKIRFALPESIGCIAPFDGSYCTEVPVPLIEECLLR